CPTCHRSIAVPHVRAVSEGPTASVPQREASTTSAPRLAAGATQVSRSTGHAPPPTKKFIPRSHHSDNSLLKYVVLLAVVVILGGAAYFYGLPMLTNALQQPSTSNPPAGAQSSEVGGGRGPMGEVGGAMDVSDALDGGSSPKPRSAPATNNSAR